MEQVEKCGRCKGEGWVKTALYHDGYEQVFGDIDCPRCGGSGRRPTPEQKAEQRALYGVEGTEYY